MVKFNNAHYLRNLQRLFLIDLSGNREFSFVNDSIKHNFFTSYNLFKIICRHCNLVGIHREMFSSWEYLLDIDLSHNNIREVSVNAFDPLEHLGYINLSYNPLSKIQLNHSRARNLICVHCSINEIGNHWKMYRIYKWLITPTTSSALYPKMRSNIIQKCYESF